MWSEHADRQPVAYQGLHARQQRRAVLIHTNGGGSAAGSLYGWWTAHANGSMGRDNLHIGAHFQIPWSGRAQQYVNTDLVVYHAFAASEWAVGIEVQDDGDPSRPMSDAQLAAIVDICRELHVPGQEIASAVGGDGVGWHSKFPSWNQTGHDCPGGVRVEQIRTHIIPALAGAPQEDDMPTADELATAIFKQMADADTAIRAGRKLTAAQSLAVQAADLVAHRVLAIEQAAQAAKR